MEKFPFFIFLTRILDHGLEVPLPTGDGDAATGSRGKQEAMIMALGKQGGRGDCSKSPVLSLRMKLLFPSFF